MSLPGFRTGLIYKSFPCICIIVSWHLLDFFISFFSSAVFEENVEVLS